MMSIVLTLLVASLGQTAMAQPFTGTVSDEVGSMDGAVVVVNHDARAVTDASGLFAIDTARAPSGDRVTAGAVGYLTSWIDLTETDVTSGLAFLLAPLPDDDPAFAPVSPSRCYECHSSYGRGWSGMGGYRASAHARAASNAQVLDVFAGTASGRTHEASCAEVGGSFETVMDPDGVNVQRCYVGVGMLADMNPQCGHEGQPRCDDASAPASAQPTSFGDCAGCHTPGAAIALPAELDLRVAELEPSGSAVTCEVCHRIREVLEPNAPGVLEGALVSRAVEPDGTAIALGPLPDAAFTRMRTSYSPLHATSLVCAPCHQDTYAPEGTAERWPDGVPSEQTYEEWIESPYASGEREQTCQGCHMPSVADLGVDPGLPIIGAGGPDRDASSMHSHAFDPLTDPSTLEKAIGLTLETRVEGGEIVATATVTNEEVGHGFPSGVTSRNVILLVTATTEAGARLRSSGGEVVPHYAGALLAGSIVAHDGGTVTLDRDAPATLVGRELRAWIETGDHRDYVGFGVIRSEPLEGKGLRATQSLGTFRVMAVRGSEVDIEGVATGLDLTGARFAIGDERYLAGTAGFGFAKVNVAADGTPDVPFWRAVDILWDNRLAPDESQTTEHRFRVPSGASGTVTVTARLAYRKTFVALADERGWPFEDVEAGVTSAQLVIAGSDAGVADAGTGTGDAGATPPPSDADGCGCRIAAERTPAAWLHVLAVFVVATGLVRRARRRR